MDSTYAAINLIVLEGNTRPNSEDYSEEEENDENQNNKHGKEEEKRNEGESDLNPTPISKSNENDDKNLSWADIIKSLDNFDKLKFFYDKYSSKKKFVEILYYLYFTGEINYPPDFLIYFLDQMANSDEFKDFIYEILLLFYAESIFEHLDDNEDKLIIIKKLLQYAFNMENIGLRILFLTFIKMCESEPLKSVSEEYFTSYILPNIITNFKNFLSFDFGENVKLSIELSTKLLANTTFGDKIFEIMPDTLIESLSKMLNDPLFISNDILIYVIKLITELLNFEYNHHDELILLNVYQWLLEQKNLFINCGTYDVKYNFLLFLCKYSDKMSDDEKETVVGDNNLIKFLEDMCSDYTIVNNQLSNLMINLLAFLKSKGTDINIPNNIPDNLFKVIYLIKEFYYKYIDYINDNENECMFITRLINQIFP